jgi:hypothetical protein
MTGTLVAIVLSGMAALVVARRVWSAAKAEAWEELGRSPRSPTVHLLFVECRGDRLVVDGLRETTGPGGRCVDAPFSLCFRRPQAAVEQRFLELLHDSGPAGPIEVTVDSGKVRFRSRAGGMVLPLDGVSGWPMPD